MPIRMGIDKLFVSRGRSPSVQMVELTTTFMFSEVDDADVVAGYAMQR